MPRSPLGPPPPPSHREGSGTPMVLLHGLFGTWRVWTPVLPALAARHDVLAPTMLGHAGGTPHPSDREIRLADIADDVERAMDDAGFEQAHVVGNSLGGWVTLELARRGRATSAVGLSPAGGWTTSKQLQKTAKMMRQAAWFDARASPAALSILRRPRARKLALRGTMLHGDRVPAGAALEMVDDLGACSILEPFLAATVRDGPFDAGDLAQMDCPILIAWAEKDRTIPFGDYGSSFAQRLPDAEIVHLPGVGHVPMFDDPELIARTILGHTGRVDARVGA